MDSVWIILLDNKNTTRYHMYMATAFGPKKTPKTYDGKSTQLGAGGRAAKLKDEGVPGAVIGAIARSKGAAPGQKFYRPSAKKK